MQAILGIKLQRSDHTREKLGTDRFPDGVACPGRNPRRVNGTTKGGLCVDFVDILHHICQYLCLLALNVIARSYLPTWSRTARVCELDAIFRDCLAPKPF